ncbi:MAG: alpha/beta fold hydrolase [Hyphomicrobiaceae bacterium]|nr:MAG: alpha/beta fold hydrolase [Hyphomicrobiaceae bacterium]
MAVRQSLVLVPGLLCTAALWAPQMAALADIADMTVPDHTRHDSMAAIAGSILEAAPERFALAGLSMGGYIAFEIVRRAPERVMRLALLDTGARPDTPERKELRLRRNELARREGAGAVQDELMPALIHKDRLADKALTGMIRQMAVDTGAEAMARQHAAIMGRPDNRPLLPRIECPTLVVVGREDALTPIELAQEMVAGIPGARLEIIPDCGHLSTLERPEAVNRVLRVWLTP